MAVVRTVPGKCGCEEHDNTCACSDVIPEADLNFAGTMRAESCAADVVINTTLVYSLVGGRRQYLRSGLSLSGLNTSAGMGHTSGVFIRDAVFTSVDLELICASFGVWEFRYRWYIGADLAWDQKYLPNALWVSGPGCTSPFSKGLPTSTSSAGSHGIWAGKNPGDYQLFGGPPNCFFTILLNHIMQSPTISE